MGLFTKKLVLCPICNADLGKQGSNLDHWETQHVTEIPEGQGDASGQYTWVCSCGPANMKWPKTYGAAAGLGLHMQERHGIPL